MTSFTVSSLDDIRAATPERLYLRPLPVSGPPARAVARIGGGGAGFDALEVIFRQEAGVLRAAAPLETVLAWSRRQGAEVALRVDATLSRITDPRPPFAGVAMDAPRLMGVVNVTPDSFSDGGDHATPEAALNHALGLAEAGAELLDIGGESTRPGAEPVPEAEERARVLPVIKALAAAKTTAALSIDTRKAALMRDAVAAGAGIINDVSALAHDPAALETVGKLDVPVILMHSLGDPRTMQQRPAYGHAPSEIFDALAARIEACEAAGIARAHIAVDPGIGFGKTAEHNLAILADVALYHGLGCPVVLGVSRKSFIAHIAGEAPPKARLAGSLAAALWAAGQGVQVLRVHDVAETRQALAVWRGIEGAAAGA